MKILMNASKIFYILALVSFSILLTWFGGDIQIAPIIAPIIFPQATIQPSHYASTDRTDNTIWSSMSGEFKLEKGMSDSLRVQAEIHKILADQEKFHQILEAAAPYIYFIHQQTKARGLPAELALIPIIESEFNPNDHSTKGATGLWQLMPQTAKELGIKSHTGYDGRRDVVASTKAALAYFNDLGNDFKGNWYLAIAAYNCGQVKVAHEMKKTGIKSFWNLPLPKETKYYVPKLIAVAEIIKNPKKYGVKLPPVSNQPYFVEKKITKPVSLQQVAKSTGVNIKTLTKLNPGLHGKVQLPKKGSISMLMPIPKTAKS